MLNENPNNFFWKNKLEDAESLSAETLQDKNTTWEKLHNRLHQKPHGKKIIWYWAAAACLLPAILILLMPDHKNGSNLVKNNIFKGEVTKPESAAPQPLKKDENAVIRESPAGKKSTLKSIIKNNNNNAAARINKEPLQTNMNRTATNEKILSVPVIDSPFVTTIAMGLAKKKLKVVHINELGDPVEERTDMARNTYLHSFQLKLANQEVYIHPSSPSVNTGFTLLKTKSTPSN